MYKSTTLGKIQETRDQVISTEILLSLKEGEIPIILKNSPSGLKKTMRKFDHLEAVLVPEGQAPFV